MSYTLCRYEARVVFVKSIILYNCLQIYLNPAYPHGLAGSCFFKFKIMNCCAAAHSFYACNEIVLAVGLEPTTKLHGLIRMR